jgi:hypothetical protein
MRISITIEQTEIDGGPKTIHRSQVVSESDALTVWEVVEELNQLTAAALRAAGFSPSNVNEALGE